MPFVDPPEPYARLPRLPSPPRALQPYRSEPPEGRVASLESVAVDGGVLDLSDAADWEIIDSTLTGVTVDASGDSQLTLLDSVLVDCDLSRVRLSALRGSRLAGCKMAGTDLSAGHGRDVVFERCALLYTNLRMVTLDRTRFDDCRFDDVDLTEANLTDVSFATTSFSDVNMTKARFERVDLRGIDELGGTLIDSLSGCLIGDRQVQALAYALALATGASIERSPD